jgi:hypothetical protein
MATIKRVSGAYTIQSVNPTDVINLNTSLVTINGNLVVTGNSQSIVSTNSEITNAFIVLNNGSTVPNPLGGNIIVDRGSSANVALRWNETITKWQITNDGTNYGNLVASISGNITTTANLVIQYQATPPSITSGYNTVYAATPGSGGSGLFVTNTSYTNAELATRSKAIAYSIIFG